MKYTLEQITDAIFANFLVRQTHLTDTDGNSFTPGLAYEELAFLKGAKDKNTYIYATRIGASVGLTRKTKQQIYALYENAMNHGRYTYHTHMNQEIKVEHPFDYIGAILKEQDERFLSY